MATLWRTITNTDQAYCERFVEIMQETHVSFRALTVEQLQSWINPADGGPYAGDTVMAAGWFANAADLNFADRMQMVVLTRYRKGKTFADVFMIGWAPAQRPNNPTLLDYMVDQLVELGQEWLQTIQPDGSLKTIRGIHCKSVENVAAKRLQEHLHWRGAIEPQASPPAPYFQIINERDLRDAFLWDANILA